MIVKKNNDYINYVGLLMFDMGVDRLTNQRNAKISIFKNLIIQEFIAF